MTSIVLEGNRFDRTISEAEFAAIQSAKDSRDVTSVWGRIQDWFCGTRKEEAKQALFIFLNEEREGSERLAAFNTLYKQVAGPYKDNFDCKILEGNQFVVSITCGNTEFTLKQPCQSELVVAKIGAGLDKEFSRGAVPKQLKLDVHRQDCSFSGGGYDLRYIRGDGIDEQTKVEGVESFLNDCKTGYQKYMLNILASQSGIGELLVFNINENKAFPPEGSGRFFNIDVHKLRSDNIRVDIVYENAATSEFLEAHAPEDYYKAIQIAASFVIGSEQTVCLKADFSAIE